MRKYLRFGEIPKGGRSVNFLKISNDRNETFTYLLNCGDIDLAYEEIPEEALEPGVSVFELNDAGQPVLSNLKMFRSFCGRLGGGKKWGGGEVEPYTAYIIEGEEVGRGNDGEPLVSDVHVVRKLDYDPEEFLQFAIEELKIHFKHVKPEERLDNSRNLTEHWETHGWDAEKQRYIQTVEYYLGGWAFRDPIEGFDCEK